ncbi:MAG: PepSY-associated TM helix domain-containing protein [Steroidobacteraceae bacterium]
MRTALVLLHRWFGLAVALFLFIAGVTGAVISWDHELDAWLNPTLYEAKSSGTPKPSLELAAIVEAADPRVRVTYLPLGVEPNEALQMSVSPRVDPATGKLYDVNYNQVAIDPVSGEIQGQRYWGKVSLTRENLLPFLYKLHYSMHIPDMSGIEIGVLFMGIIGIVWVVDCFIALYLSFPNFSSWRKSFAFRWKQGGHKLNFDLHRSGGVWVWLLLLLLAVTSVSMNLNTEVMRPVVSWFSTLSPSPFASRTPVLAEKAPEPKMTAPQIITLAQQEAVRRGWSDPAGGLFYSAEFDLFGVGFFKPGNDHGDGGLGNPWLYFDAQNGSAAGAEVPGTGTAGDIFMQAQFPLHSGRILGITGRVLISLMGAVVAMLSVTGIVIWVRKRRARVLQQRRDDLPQGVVSDAI